MKTTPESNAPGWLLESAKLKDKALATLAEMPEELRQKVVADDSWSAAAVVEHLIIVEEQLAGPWRAALGSRTRFPAFKSGVMATMACAVLAQTDMRVPTVPTLVPSGGLALSELISRWELARAKLTSTLPDNSKVAWIVHPVFGPLSSDQMGKLLVSHLKHHLRHWPKPKA